MPKQQAPQFAKLLAILGHGRNFDNGLSNESQMESRQTYAISLSKREEPGATKTPTKSFHFALSNSY